MFTFQCGGKPCKIYSPKRTSTRIWRLAGVNLRPCQNLFTPLTGTLYSSSQEGISFICLVVESFLNLKLFFIPSFFSVSDTYCEDIMDVVTTPTKHNHIEVIAWTRCVPQPWTREKMQDKQFNIFSQFQKS